ncbi:thiol reductant ABC exporter subunit CydD [Bacillus sp. HMF5848]|uniref:thiol reductant ABC exporter subunit CydD n=1 Tax=Bacillus sp. HMF5848 TaxID=2495421 RepID=UPI000F7A94C9|nr:thiol reductant ABC exporter subunit CydD [Bacillus sp. HMF5848]RSK28494.1 thiol reductant ABC exporter subunit CydD [Bacillus sp. HMF5848]
MNTLQKLARNQKGRYYALFAMAIAFGVFVITQAYLIVSVVEDIFLKKHGFQQVVPSLIGLLAVLFLRALLQYGTSHIGIKMASVVKMEFRKKLLQTYANQTILSSSKEHSGSKVSVMLDTVDEIESFYSKYVPQRIISTVVTLIILIVIFSQHIYSGLIILFTAPFIPFFMIIIGKATQQKSEEKLDSLTAFSGRFLDTLQGMLSLKLYGKSSHYKEVIRTSSVEFRDTTMAILKIAFTSSFMLEFISMLSIGLVALELGLRLVVFQQVSFFTAFFILLLVPEFFHLLKELGSAFHAGRSSSGAAAKIQNVLGQEHTATNDTNLNQDRKLLQWGQQSLKDKFVKIELKKIGFSYDGDGFSLTNINAVLPTVGQVAIVGRSGAGKTTLLHIIAGLLKENGGDILMNGVPRSSYAEKEWFKNISYITQNPFLFAGTIAENIALGLDMTMDEIEAASRKANIHELIVSLPNGYETNIGEGGRGLSGGEKQRIALARAFLKNPSIILFDEPTSGLDLVTEQVLQQSIQLLSEQAVIITVAHRLHTIKQANHILFMHNGTIYAQGTHEHLNETVESYRGLFSRTEEGGEL